MENSRALTSVLEVTPYKPYCLLKQEDSFGFSSVAEERASLTGRGILPKAGGQGGFVLDGELFPFPLSQCPSSLVSVSAHVKIRAGCSESQTECPALPGAHQYIHCGHEMEGGEDVEVTRFWNNKEGFSRSVGSGCTGYQLQTCWIGIP